MKIPEDAVKVFRKGFIIVWNHIGSNVIIVFQTRIVVSFLLINGGIL